MADKPLDAGSKAPRFCLQDADENWKCLSDYLGGWIVIYFYPKDNTPGCTLEAMDFSSLREDFEREKAVILGISKDSCKSHQEFIDKKGLTITLLSDPEAKAQAAYGVWGPKRFMGKEFLGTKRTTFLIDPAGEVARVWSNVKVRGHAEDVLASLRALKGV